MEPEKTPNSQSNVEKEKQSWRHYNSGLYGALENLNHQDSMVRHKNRHIYQRNRIGNAEMDPQVYGQLIINKAGRSIQWKKDSLFSKWCLENWTATTEE